eukprot:TRINITY_DN63533_c0_g1_i1.p1 TRINITY_DN63533_c0_g1~~TRINITY_DN63533_c0_g1_i1.p1  ORF type:complete len:403 (-),score=80.42 TRINITY_DN63533_c0_g1_i1:95-1261(-)
MEAVSPLSELAGDSPQGEVGDDTPHGGWDSGWGSPEGTQDLNSIQHHHMTAVTSLSASQATSAAWHADIAAKQAASLAQWVQYLWNQVATLQHKVTELEDWKKKALDEMSKLRLEHKILRRKVLPDAEASDEVPHTPKAKSSPLLLAEHVGDACSNLSSGAPSPIPFKRKQKKATTEGAVNANGAKKTDDLGPPPGLEDQVEKEDLISNQAASDGSGLESASPRFVVVDEGHLEGVHVERGVVDFTECECAEWRIGHLSAKLKNCMGRALVSSPFSAWGLEDLRLMVFPDGKEVAKGPRSKRQKDQYSRKVTEGPLEGCLKLKVPDCPAPHILEYYLKIGTIRKGPFRHNFAESTVNGCADFGIDWLRQVDGDQSLTVTVEILAFPVM